MANDSVSIVGNLTADPILHDGKTPRASFRVAVNRKFGEEEKTTFVPVTAFGTLAENIVESLHKGNRVSVQGRLDSYEKAVEINGEEKNISMLTVVADNVGPDLRWATAKVARVASNGGGAKSAQSADEVEEAPAPRRKAPAKAAASRSRKPAASDLDDDLF